MLRLSCCIGVQAPEQELDLELPDDMALDGDQGDEEEQEVKEDEAGNQQPDNSVQQPFPESLENEASPVDEEGQKAGADAHEEGPPEEGGVPWIFTTPLQHFKIRHRF